MGPIIFILAAACLLPALDASILKRQTGGSPNKCTDVPLELSFVVDSSVSIRQENFTLGLWFIQDFIDKFNIGQDKVRVSMVTYGQRVYSEDSFALNKYSVKSELNNAVNSVPHRKGRRTETGAGINWFLDNQLPQARPGVRHVLIVLTDGNSQEPDLTKAAAHRAAETGLDVFAIGVGRGIGEQELHNIASDAKHVFMVGSYGMLDHILQRLAYEACNVVPVPSCQFDPVDIAFVIDSSVSIGEDNFTLGLEFINEFLDPFTINPSSIRVAAIMFADRVYDEYVIPFDMYKNKKDTQDAILQLKWVHGTSTETGQGIDYMVQNFLPHTRSHAAHIGIVLTDGESQNRVKTQKSAEKARDAGLTMYAIGVGNSKNTRYQKELLNIAGHQSRVFLANNYGSLNTIKSSLTDKTCVEIEGSIQAQHGR